MLVQVYEAYPEDVRLVFRHFPLSMHDKAMLGAQIANAVGAQEYDMFFTFKNLIFEERETWVGMTPEQFTKWALDEAADLGLDRAQLEKDMNDEAMIADLQKEYDEGIAAGVTGTPYIFINGSSYEGQRSFEIFSALVELFKLQDIQYTECPPQVIDETKNYQATIHLEKGDVVMDLFADKTPVAVNSFVFLAQEGWFDGVAFHRVIPDFVAQTGDPTGQGYGGPGYTFDNEIMPELTFDGPGMVGMANSGENLNGSQFFISYDSLPNLDGGYTVFGKVIEGMDVVEALQQRDPSQGGNLPDGDVILSITIEEL